MFCLMRLKFSTVQMLIFPGAKAIKYLFILIFIFLGISMNATWQSTVGVFYFGILNTGINHEIPLVVKTGEMLSQ